MEVQSRVNSVTAKRLWNVLRIAFFMVRKGLLSKKKLMMDMNFMMKKGKLLGKSLSNIIHHNYHHHHHQSHPHNSKHVIRGNFGIQAYEFSCSNSPNPTLFHMPKRKHHYFPCMSLPEVVEEEERRAVVMVPKTPEYMFNFQFDGSEFAPGEKRSPILSPFAVRISNYASEDDENCGENVHVDGEAEEFIERFYEQLRAQSRIQSLPYHEMQYH